MNFLFVAFALDHEKIHDARKTKNLKTQVGYILDTTCIFLDSQ